MAWPFCGHLNILLQNNLFHKNSDPSADSLTAKGNFDKFRLNLKCQNQITISRFFFPLILLLLLLAKLLTHTREFEHPISPTTHTYMGIGASIFPKSHWQFPEKLKLSDDLLVTHPPPILIGCSWCHFPQMPLAISGKIQIIKPSFG